jgi:preprotein translocase subunit SecF
MDWLKNRLAESKIDFVGLRRKAAVLSTILVVSSLLLFATKGPRWGIDFTGGTEIHLAFSDDLEIGELREALSQLGLPSDAVQEVGGEGESEFKIRIQDPEFGAQEMRVEVVAALKSGMGETWVADWEQDVTFSAEVGARFSVIYTGDRTTPSTVAKVLSEVDGVYVEEGREDQEMVIKFPGLASQVRKQIAVAMQDRNFEVLAVDAVGPKVGEALRQQGFTSLIATLALVLLYVGFRFDIAFAPGAVAALIHDVVVTVGVFIVLDKEFNLPMIGALLTIVGYSLNDTIVIYDRIRENRTRYRRQDLPELINVSINETLTRTVATSFTTFFAISAFVVVGSPVIRDFVLAMMCGVVFGTYSTMFVASPMILSMEKFKPYIEGLMASPISQEDIDEGDDIPEAFLSESEKRRRERTKKEKELDEQTGE